MEDPQDILEQEAIRAIVWWGKSMNTLPTSELKEAVSKALEVFNSENEDITIAHRVIAAKQLITSSIHALKREQLNKVDAVVLAIARDYKIKKL